MRGILPREYRRRLSGWRRDPQSGQIPANGHWDGSYTGDSEFQRPGRTGRVVWRWNGKEHTQLVALSSTASTSFPPGLAASAYNPQRRLRPNRAPCSVHCQRTR